MGGELTQNVQQAGPVTIQTASPPAVAQPVSATPTGSLQPLEIHKSGSEIHFHDRVNNRKCAVPAAEYYVMRRDMCRLVVSRWIDPLNKTILTLTPVFDGVKVEAYLEVQPCEIGDTFAALARYTNGAK